MKFSRLGPVGSGPDKGPVHPIEIFEKLPSLPNSPNDLWRGQAEALEGWHQARKRSDALIALNTGAGKTVIGILIAQSLVNEGVENVIYVCATIDLVRQTSNEANKIGIPHTIRVEQGFDNNLFESGKGFCITTYQALFNGRSSIRKNYFPGAVIFDDAHVAESVLRDAFTIRIDGRKEPKLLQEIAALFTPHFREVERFGQFKDAITGAQPTIVLAAPPAVRASAAQLSAVIDTAIAKSDPENHGYAFEYLRDRMNRCAVLFGGGVCEITPPFLPSLALDIFQRDVRRIYLSATLQFKTDFVRAFGRQPSIIVEPKNDAGNGERLILDATKLSDTSSDLLFKSLIQKYKLLIAVPSYSAAERWEYFGKPPAVKEFSAQLSAFRQSKNPSAFILVSRVDGIDLPHDTCRLMILDGLPSGTSLIEQYLWQYINLKNMSATKIANRIAQLFGRINRGRNDYGVFFVIGRGLSSWLQNDRHVALLPDLLQQQITLGRYVQENMETGSPQEVRGIIGQVLGRDAEWIKYYGENVDKSRLDAAQVGRAKEIEAGQLTSAEAASRYAQYMWEGDIKLARHVLEESVEATGRADNRLAGWHNIWLGGCYEAEGDLEAADTTFRRARLQLGVNFALPRFNLGNAVEQQAPLSAFAAVVDGLCGTGSAERFAKETRKLRNGLADLGGGNPAQMEEAVRALGEALGFDAIRPDNDFGTGPDVLWECTESNQCIAFELKTDKQNPAQYSRKDVAQGHDSLSWVRTNKKTLHCHGLIFVGPGGKCGFEANPSAEMWLTQPEVFLPLRDLVLAIVNDVRALMPLGRRAAAIEKCDRPDWKIGALFEKLKGTPLQSLK